MSKFKVAVIVGSNRRDSINRKLAQAMTRLVESRLEFEFVGIDELPMYNADLEGNRPDSVNLFTSRIAAADAVFVVTPEHNRSIPAVLKNAIDWGSKPAGQNVWKGKPAAITGTSPGAIGTAVGQQHLRQILAVLGSTVMGGEAYISFKPDLIDASGAITNDSTRSFLQAYMDGFAELVSKLAPAR